MKKMICLSLSVLAWTAPLLAQAAAAPGPAAQPAAVIEPPSLSRVKTVYVMPMGAGADQYLANHLISRKVFQITTDPQRADALLTDQIGAGFEKRFLELYPPPKPAEEEQVDEQQSPEGASLELKSTANDRISSNSWGRGKGNVYLVHVSSRQVLWSTYRKPKSLESKDLDSNAEKIVERLQLELGGPKN